MLFNHRPADNPAPFENAPYVTSVFVVPDNAERAIGALLDHGISASQISVATRAPNDAGDDASDGANDAVIPDAVAAHNVPIYKDKDGFMEVQTNDPPTPTDMNAATDSRVGGSSTATMTDSPVAAEGERGITTTTPADAARGAKSGSLVGLGVGLLAGAAALTIPGVGLVLAAGPLWAALGAAAGATAAGAVAGGATGYLRDMGVSPGAADLHHEALASGGTLVMVHLDAKHEAGEIAALCAKYGGAMVS